MRFLTRIDYLQCLPKQISLIFLPLLLSCGETLVGSDPVNTPQNNFQILWEEFDRYYSLFEAKNVDWSALYDIYAPQVTPQTDDRALFDILASMLTHLNDGHVDLIAPFRYFNSRTANERSDGTLNLDLIKRKYLNSGFQTSMNGFFLFGQVSNAIAYLHIASFSSTSGSTWVDEIDSIVNEFFDHRGFIIDVRGNRGGDSRNVEAIAGRFADQKRLSSLGQVRNGPRHSDFTPIIELYVKPAGSKQFTKPIVVLTDRQTLSAGEYFVLAMMQLPHVTVIGDVTSGVMGVPIRRELPNGWIYRIPTAKWFSADHVLYEGVGIPPDIHVAVSPSDTDMEKDPVIEMAIQLLQ